jgi:hypothetical protein
MVMSASDIEHVRALRRAGWVYDQIARKLGVSRGAVAGVLDRARKAGEVLAPGERAKRSPKTRSAPAEPVAAAPCEADASEHHHHDHHDDDAPRVPPPEPIRAPFGPKTIFQLREGDCRFPFGDVRQGGEILRRAGARGALLVSRACRDRLSAQGWR